MSLHPRWQASVKGYKRRPPYDEDLNRFRISLDPLSLWVFLQWDVAAGATFWALFLVFFSWSSWLVDHSAGSDFSLLYKFFFSGEGPELQTSVP